MPVIRQTLPIGDQFDGTAGKGLVEFAVGQALGASIQNSDELAAILILYSLKSDQDADIAVGSMVIKPTVASQGPSDCVQLEKWDDGRSAVTKPCNLPVPQTYQLVFNSSVLTQEATLTVWWKVGVPGV
ncbi:MAG TPA: hypothetical protein VM487_13980 [Phycisphaerae bacterium]|nr:hypothetical protein [Phycisphaerae bacterium]